ncbi:MAG: beta-lactamase family protein [Candidatus Eremiobacteraeota bacterium]|nr:beta-lactamase family protein [Candidatus Eremiobacteraeota bacterium]
MKGTALCTIVVTANLLAAAPLGLAAQATSDLSPTQTAAIDRFGQISVSEGFAPSVVISVERDGKSVYLHAFGNRTVHPNVSAQPSTPYMIGSNTKQFAAASILLLQDEGKLNVDDRLSKYFPDIPHSSEVTLRELLTMSSGYADYVEAPTFLQAMRQPALSPNEAVDLVRSLPLDFAPGSRWQYSNTGYMLAQMVIEKVTGTTFHNFLQQHFFGPLGMHATYLRLSNNVKPNVAVEYSSFALGPWEPAPFWDYSWIGAAGGLVSDASDLGKWNAALDGGKLLSSRSQGEMFAAGPAASSSGGEGYGMGIRVGKMPNGHRFIWHGGNAAGSATQDARFPDDHLAIIVLSNAPYYSYNTTVRAIYKLLVPLPTPRGSAAPAPPPSAKGDSQRVRAAVAWLDDAIAGKPNTTNVTSEMRALLTPNHLAALRALSKYGPRTYELEGVDRRKPTTTYFFTLKALKKTMTYIYKWDDDGKVADIVVLPDMEFSRPQA